MPLVVVEGIDGSGKSTISKALAEAAGAHRKVYPSHDGAAGRLIRAILRGTEVLDKRAMQHLFIADGLDHDVDVERRVSLGELVILDRHPTISGWVYQVETTPIDFVQQINMTHCFTAIDLIFIVDVPTAVATARIQARDKPADVVYEAAHPDVIEARRSRYFAYKVMHPQCIMIDGQQPVADNVSAMVRVLDDLRATLAGQN
jgi:dTMP kinase